MYRVWSSQEINIQDCESNHDGDRKGASCFIVGICNLLELTGHLQNSLFTAFVINLVDLIQLVGPPILVAPDDLHQLFPISLLLQILVQLVEELHTGHDVVVVERPAVDFLHIAGHAHLLEPLYLLLAGGL